MGIIISVMLLATTPLHSQQLDCGEGFNAISYKWSVFESYLRYLATHPRLTNETKTKVIYIDCPATVPCDCSEPSYNDDEQDYESDYENS